MARMNMVQAINLALRQEMAADESVVVLGEDVGIDGGVFRVTDGLIGEFGEGRVMDTPLAEAAIIGTSIGMALGGLKPVAEMQFSGFSYLAVSQLEGAASRYRSRTLGQRTVPLVMRMPYGGGVRALEHHSESREALYAHIPGLKVVLPSGPRNARALLVAAIRDPDPVIFMEPKRTYRAYREDVPEEVEVLPLGEARVVQEGSDITLVSWGAMMRPTLAAASHLAETKGTSVEVIDLLTVSPLDGEAVARSVRKTGRCVVVQESPQRASIGSDIIAQLNDRALLYLEAPVKRVSGYDVVTPYWGRENNYIPDEGRIVAGVEETLSF
jgi:pyruvate dehydrogenase E1 component beta subunit